MAHTLSAKKRIRQNVKRRALNRWRKNQVKDAVREFEEALKGGRENKKAIADALNVCYKQLDKTAARNTIHKNAAARKKARLTAAMNKAIA